MSRPFHFKQFSITQERAAMKVGTDAVLLGAWSENNSPKHILDIGCGTGILSLMLAQRYPNALIEAIDIDSNALSDADENFNASPWSSRIKLHEQDIFDMQLEQSYDLIVCNPPFFEKDSAAKGESREHARQGKAFRLEEMIQKAMEMLRPGGKLALVYPWPAWKDKWQLLNDNSVFLNRINYLRPTPNKECHRVLLELSKEESTIAEESMVLELSRHHYSEDYKRLTKEFYLDKS